MKKINYKFGEGKLIKELKKYIDSTYNSYYSDSKYQSSEIITDCGYGEGFYMGNILKYSKRYGKKEGKNIRDLWKVVHYALMMINLHREKEKHNERSRQQARNRRRNNNKGR